MSSYGFSITNVDRSEQVYAFASANHRRLVDRSSDLHYFGSQVFGDQSLSKALSTSSIV